MDNMPVQHKFSELTTDKLRRATRVTCSCGEFDWTLNMAPPDYGMLLEAINVHINPVAHISWRAS